VIQSSGVGFYGHRGDEAISEDAPPGGSTGDSSRYHPLGRSL
jgi:NAD dependent epimerase/dehydratase family enzyme